MTKPTYPETANNAVMSDDGRQFAPSTPRNRDPILALLTARLGTSGRFLEIASGTGEHVVHFAENMPDWRFQPTELDPDRIGSIRAWVDHSGVSNVAEPAHLDASKSGWGQTVEVDAIGICNLFHLISESHAKTIIGECAKALAPRGKLIIYGPFMRAGELTSDGDDRFHNSLVAHNNELGYKDDFDMLDWIESAGLMPEEIVEMPANNLSLIAVKTI
ncbi:MAG: DUF938 domain-containing protein [Paracoccaceae bacterium]|jgi:cyclopropane fatty-acyl-phospholipid synthase-like methyltransferase|nr:DUF938 domain-containing protein [Paracoccaceae bacterium]